MSNFPLEKAAAFHIGCALLVFGTPLVGLAFALGWWMAP